jgi:ubiquinone/menaquinone biosynthesis C-methylase UbiE
MNVLSRNEKVKTYFHSNAAQFDRLYNKTGFVAHWFNLLFRKALYKRSQLALQECLSCQAKSVLDVGCGSGVNAVLLANNGIPKVTGLDYADGMLALARTMLPETLRSKVGYIKGDLMEWQSSEKFDCVMALGVFDYLDRPGLFLDKMKSFALKKVIFSVPGKGNLRQFIRTIRYTLRHCPLYFYNRKDLKKLLEYPGTTAEIKKIGSSGYLCILTLPY